LPWAITFHNPLAAELSGTPLNQPLHPTELYEFVAEAINFALLYWLCKRKKFEGQIIALFMIIYGAKLVEATWLNSIDEFPELSVGVTYLPIPVGGVALLLFVIERVLIGPPRDQFAEPTEAALAPIRQAGLAPGQEVN
jgi:hypothetical protein